MINNYNDHAANERTYLAWIRTAVAIMAFGFLIERFDLFVSYLGRQLADNDRFQPSSSAELVGLVLILVAILMIVTATTRFLIYKKAIDAEQLIPYSSVKTNLVLSTLLVLVGLFTLVYIVHLIPGQ